MDALHSIAADIRKKVLAMAACAGGAHIASSYSAVEILTVLYFEVMRLDTKCTGDDRDRFIMSKGHASAAIYAILALRGFLDPKLLKTYCRPGTILGGHPEKHLVPGIEVSTGSLGHGLSIETGMAHAAKMDKKDYRVFVLMGDGECQEGSVWEAALLASQLKLDNIVAIVDYNKLQALDRTENILGLEPFADKWRAFGWAVAEVDGHSLESLTRVFRRMPLDRGRPSLLIAHTVKGKGISFMEEVPIWHYRLPNEEEMSVACRELGIKDFESILT